LAKPNLNLNNSPDKESRSESKRSSTSSLPKKLSKEIQNDFPLIQGGEDSSVKDKRDKIKEVR